MKNFKRVLSLALAALMVIGGLVVAPVDAKAADTYTRASKIESGKNYVLVLEAMGSFWAVNTTVTSSRCQAVEVNVVNGTTLEKKEKDIPVWTFEQSGTEWTMKGNGKYLQATVKNKVSLGDPETATPVKFSAEVNDGLFRFPVKLDGLDCNLCGNENNGNWATPQFAFYQTGKNSSGQDNVGEKNNKFMLFEYSGNVEIKEDIDLGDNPSPKEIVDAAYKAMEDGVHVKGTHQLEGVITSVDYDKAPDSITVTIQIGDMADKKIQCYNLTVTDKTDEAALAELKGLDEGDTITVEGKLGYYNGKVQFNAGSILKEVEKAPVEPGTDEPGTDEPGTTEPSESESDTTKPEEKYTELTKELLAQFAAADATKETLFEGKYQATGTVTEVDASGFAEFGNIEFTLKIDGVGEILCWRVTVDKEDAIKVGDVLTVKGEIKNYKGLVEFVKPTFEKGKVDAKGDMTTAGIVMILFAGIALVSVAAYSKKRMAR